MVCLLLVHIAMIFSNAKIKIMFKWYYTLRPSSTIHLPGNRKILNIQTFTTVQCDLELDKSMLQGY